MEIGYLLCSMKLLAPLPFTSAARLFTNVGEAVHELGRGSYLVLCTSSCDLDAAQIHLSILCLVASRRSFL
jgi:hypothetical protein